MHKGFQSALKSQWKKSIFPRLQEYANDPDSHYNRIVICATGTYIHWRKCQVEKLQSEINTQLYTFGAPLAIHWKNKKACK